MLTTLQRSGLFGLLLLAAGCPKPPVQLSSIAVSPDNGRIAQGDTLQYVANGLYSDGSSKVITDQVEWFVDDALVGTASVEQPGLVTALAPGDTTVRARLNGVQGSRSLTVIPATIRVLQLYPPRPVAPIGLPIRMQLMAVHTDNTVENVTERALWSSSDTSAFTVEAGLLHGVAAGIGTLTVSYQGANATAQVTVTTASVQRLDLEPTTPTLPIGVTQRFSAIATLSDFSSVDLSDSADWSSDDPAIVFATNAGSDRGVAIARTQGHTTLRAKLNAIEGSTQVTVSEASLSHLDITPTVATIARGTSVDLTAIASFTDGTTRDVTSQATWSTTSSTRLTLDSTEPWRVKGKAVGDGVVRATFGTFSAETTITVSAATLTRIELTPPSPSLARGTTQRMRATGIFSDETTQDLTTQVAWVVEPETIASVSNVMGSRGELTALNEGSASVIAQFESLSGTTPVTVTQAVLTGLQLSTSASLPVGTSVRLSATGLFSDGSTQDVTDSASWSSSAPSIASVSNLSGSKGMVQGAREGSAVITASLNGQTATTAVAVTNAMLLSLSLAPSSLALAQGTSSQFAAVGLYSDNSTRVLTSAVNWSSTDTAIATVSNGAGHFGEVTALTPGATTIRAQLGSVSATAAVTVMQKQLSSIEVTPAQVTLVAGLAQQFSALATWSDHSTQDVTSQVTWQTSPSGITSISNATGFKGLLTALKAGTATVTATLSGVTGTTSVTVTPAQLTSLTLSPPVWSATRGTSKNLRVTGTYTDGASVDLTTVALWSSSDSNVVTVSNASGSEGLAVGVGVGQATITARSGSVTATLTATITPATLVSVQLTPPLPQVGVGSSVPFTLIGLYSDTTTQDLTALASWSSSAPSVATVSNGTGTQGRATAVTQGTTTISASIASLTASTVLTVNAATLTTLAITPSTVRIASATSLRLVATGTFSDGSTLDLTDEATWASSDGAVCAVSNTAPTQGRITGGATGTTTITAVARGVSATATVTVANVTLVSLAVTPSSPSSPAGLTRQLSATGTFSDGTTQDLTDEVSWASSDTSRASVSNAPGTRGLVTALLTGSALISASEFSITAPAVTFTVSSALLTSLDITPAIVSTPKGLNQTFTASGQYTDGSSVDVTSLVTWSSSDTAVASISNASGSQGLASALTVGSTHISASLSGFSAQAALSVTPATLVSLALTPANQSKPLGISAPYTATGTYSDGTTQDVTEQASWVSSLPSIATVSNVAGTRGLANGVSVGTTVISATVAALSATANLTVTPAQLVSLGVTPVNPSIPLGLSVGLTATGVYTDGSTQPLTTSATWASSNSGIAPVSSASGSEGVVTGLTQGQATISATVGSVSGSTLVTVSPAVLQSLQITPHAPSLPAGLTQQLSATGIYSDTSTQDLTTSVSWSVANTSLVSVSNSNHGLATALLPGDTTVTATYGSVSGSTPFHIDPAILTALQVTPANASTPRGLPQQFTATGLYSNGSTQNLTTTVTWASSNGAWVSISNASGTEGLAATLSTGSGSVTATLGSITGSTPFRVTAAEVISIAVTPSTLTVPLGSVRALTATGTYTDGSTQNLTAQGSWSSSDTSVVNVSNAPGSEGVVTTLGTGPATVQFALASVTATASISVTQAALASIDLTPTNGSTALGYSRQFIAIGTYTDGTTQVLTALATWSSSDTGKAFISNGSSSRGLLSTVAVGTLTVSAVYAGITGTTQHTVSPAMLVGLAVTPANVSLAPAATRQLTATGSFSDGSSQDLTATVTWSSNRPAIAQVSNASGSQGLVTAIATGTAVITATQGSQSGTSNVTVP